MFYEKHDVGFFVGTSKKDITERAKKSLCINTHLQHCDDNLKVGGNEFNKKIDDIIEIGQVDNLYITLTPTTEPDNRKMTSFYIRLDVPDITRQAKIHKNGKELV